VRRFEIKRFTTKAIIHWLVWC